MDALNPGRGHVQAFLRLSRTPGWSDRRVGEELDLHGTVDRLLAAADGLPPTAEAEETLAACRRAGVLATALDGTAYPPALRHLPDPPPVLFHRGDLSTLAAPGVVVVGSRRATAYGRRAAGALASAAVRAGRVVISGMALGIDGAAHRGALEAGGVTVAVLGSGPDRPSPRSHRTLLTRILTRGAALSELPPGTPPRPHHFPRRNRILAALAERVVVVEAAERSGALITARLALELGREVWAVPGSIFSETSVGTHRLLEDGARPLTDLEAWRASLSRENGGTRSVPGPSSWDDPAAARLWELLHPGPRTLDELISEAAVPADRALVALTRLEVQGWVRRMPGPAYARQVA